MYLTIGGICGLLAYVIAGLFGACKMPHFVIIYISYIAIISRNVLFGIVQNSTAIVGTDCELTFDIHINIIFDLIFEYECKKWYISF